jgi:hypothetical protein
MKHMHICARKWLSGESPAGEFSDHSQGPKVGEFPRGEFPASVIHKGERSDSGERARMFMYAYIL